MTLPTIEAHERQIDIDSLVSCLYNMVYEAVKVIEAGFLLGRAEHGGIGDVSLNCVKICIII
jgi:hypothetical protein